MGDGAIEINITVYPNAPDKYNKAVTRSIEVTRLASLREMGPLTYSLGEMVNNTINAMLHTLLAREEAEAKAAAEALAGEGAGVDYVISVDNTVEG